ncbi:AAA family ATPase [Streptococcus suis]|uniref:AAA family ATPase n=1 Tax=Streptococcus suis TaxID=1307 RepID=UPI000942E4C5|nr:AAA family ATPase [Streptococcus suis]MCB2928594.1 AAA family ATPase [Streptococcus suis]MDW8648526.1 AAA family ATPase [Streptococcus suis]HEL1595288.1 AAA family ATPase [Streptococcus suis]HEL1886994.1 AAA family ATPase [Streptococcus suis]HEL1896665.1 AAA family ATPase [Streptococcus suis]
MSSFIREIKVENLPNNEYYSHIPAIKSLDKLKLSAPVTFFVGENGSGKSTLLEAIAVSLGFNAEGGTINFNFSTKETHSSLYRHIKIIKGHKRPQNNFFLRAESFYNVASYLEEIYRREIFNGYNLDNYGGIPHEHSHGQSFLGLVLNKFQPNGLYLLDEPEAALSPQNQLTFMARIHELSKAGCQFIIATHSPIIMSLPNSTVFEFKSTIEEINYKDSESYQITKLMLEDSERVFRNLLE